MKRFGIQLTEHEPDKLLRQVTSAEKLGFDSAWFPDHIISLQSASGRMDAWTVLAYLASQTRRIKLASGVSDTYRRHVATLAHMAATLDFFSNGRAILGIGAGEAVNLTNFGIEMHHPVQRLREAVTICKKLFKSSIDRPFDYDGEFFHFKQAFLEIDKVRNDGPPIYVGAQGKATRMLAGELADGWYPWLHTVDNYGSMVAEIDEGAKRIGRNPDEIDKIAVIYVAITDEPEKLLQLVAKNMKKSLVLERKTLAQYGYSTSGFPPEFTYLSFVANRSNFELLERAAQSITTDIVSKVCAVGTVDYVTGIIEKYLKSGSSNIVIRPFRNDDTVAFGKEVIPYFRE